MKKVNITNTCAAMDSLCVFAQILSAEIPNFLGNKVKRLSEKNARFFAFFYHGSLDVEEVPEDDCAREIFVKIVNVRRFRGRAYYYNHKKFVEVTNENWATIRRTIAPRTREVLTGDDKMFREKRPSYAKLFDDCKQIERYHKPSKRGFERTWKTNYRYEAKAIQIVNP